LSLVSLPGHCPQQDAGLFPAPQARTRCGRRPAEPKHQLGCRESRIPHPAKFPKFDPSATGECSANDLVFNNVLLRALEFIRGEFHERTWEAFWKVVVEGRTADDVAADLDMKPGTVLVAKSRVLLRLRRELGDIGE